MARLIESKLARGEKKKYQIIELSIIIAILITVMAIPTIHEASLHDADDTAWPNILSNCLFAIGCGMLFRSFSTFGSVSYAPTTMTANLSRFAVSLYDGLFGEDKEKGKRTAIQYALLIMTFAISAGVCYAFYYHLWGRMEGDLLISYYPNITLVLPLCLISVSLLLTKNKKSEGEKENV